jgi:hypothetical protein
MTLSDAIRYQDSSPFDPLAPKGGLPYSMIFRVDLIFNLQFLISFPSNV